MDVNVGHADGRGRIIVCMTLISHAQSARVLIAKHGNLLSASMIAKGTKEKRQITDNQIAEKLITFLEFLQNSC